MRVQVAGCCYEARGLDQQAEWSNWNESGLRKNQTLLARHSKGREKHRDMSRGA